MPIPFACSKCQKKLKAQDRQAGSRVKCSNCGQILLVPGEPSAVLAQTGPDSQDDAPAIRRKMVADEEMDMTPMIDMTFLLLIFFMVTAAFTLQKSIEMPTPDSQEGVSQSRTLEEIEEDDDYVIVKIDSDDEVWVNETRAPTRHEVIARLREERGMSGDGPSRLLVMASGDARHETVIMTLDAGAAAGMESIRLAALGADE